MIRPPAINLARRPFRNNTAYYAVYSACLALLLSATVYNGWSFWTGGAELARLREDMSFTTDRYMKLHDEVEQMKSEINTLDLEVINTKSSFAEGLILSRFFSWSLLFDRLEDLIPPEVKIQRIAPSISTKRIEITLSGMARSPDQFLEFEGNLSSSPFFSNVYPVHEDQQESQNELKFSLAMDYIPAGKDTQQAPGSEAATTAATNPAEVPAQAAAPDAATAAPVQGAVDGANAGGAVSPDASASTPPAANAPAASAQADAPAGPAGGAHQRPAKAGAAPSGPSVSVSDISQLTDEQFIEMFGYPEYVRARGKAKAKRPGGKAGKAGETAPPPADPNAVSP
jgi:Tfp pilus assembly protein PilN